jgi:hypothetical protein
MKIDQIVPRFGIISIEFDDDRSNCAEVERGTQRKHSVLISLPL